MIWAAFTLTFFGCLRASEVTITHVDNLSLKLCRQDVNFSQVNAHHIMTVRIKSSKTDKTNKGFDIVISCIPHPTCAYCAMVDYLHDQRFEPTSPLSHTNRVPLTRTLFQKQLKLYISALGFPSQNYSGHSLRAGCATSAAKAGFMDWEIKVLGRWVSDAYQG